MNERKICCVYPLFAYLLFLPCALLCLVIQSCPTLCNPWTVARQVPLSMGILQARKILEWVDMPWSKGSSQLRDGTQVSRIAGTEGLEGVHHLSHQGSPRILEWVAYPFSRGSSWPRNRTGVSCIAGRFFTSWATRGGSKNRGKEAKKYKDNRQMKILVMC